MFALVRTNGIEITFSLHPRVDNKAALHSGTFYSSSYEEVIDELMQAIVISSCLQDEEEYKGLWEEKR